MDVLGSLPLQLQEVVLLADAFVDFDDVVHSQAQPRLYRIKPDSMFL
jgi:hypothetical protein